MSKFGTVMKTKVQDQGRYGGCIGARDDLYVAEHFTEYTYYTYSIILFFILLFYIMLLYILYIYILSM